MLLSLEAKNKILKTSKNNFLQLGLENQYFFPTISFCHTHKSSISAPPSVSALATFNQSKYRTKTIDSCSFHLHQHFDIRSVVHCTLFLIEKKLKIKTILLGYHKIPHKDPTFPPHQCICLLVRLSSNSTALTILQHKLQGGSQHRNREICLS